MILTNGAGVERKCPTPIEINESNASSITSLSTFVKSPLSLPSCREGLARRRPLPAPSKRLPRCFTDHHAAPSTRRLFKQWVERADATDNGIVMINRQACEYSDTTVDRAIKWLIAHRLMLLTERGGGRGNGSRYFIRWTFAHPNPAIRQRWVNRRKPAKRVNPAPIERKTRNTSKSTRQKTSFSYEKTRERVSNLESENPTDPGYGKRTKSPPVTGVFYSCESSILGARQRRENREFRRELHEKTVGWAVSEIQRKIPFTLHPELRKACANRLRQALSSGAVFIGPELNGLVQRLAWGIEDLDSGGTTRRKHVCVGHFAKDGLNDIRVDRLRGAEGQERERQRAEAIDHPLSELFVEEGVKSMSAFIRKISKEEVRSERD